MLVTSAPLMWVLFLVIISGSQTLPPPTPIDQPWWNTDPTTEQPGPGVNSYSTQPPTSTHWWTGSTNTALSTVTPPTAALTFGDADPCVNGSFYRPGDDEAAEIWDNYLKHIRLPGGVPARKHAYPWMAVLFNGPKQFCGGSLIDKNHILTAAHCIAHMTSHDVSRLRIRLGAHNIHGSEPSVQEFKVTKVVRHKDYDARKLYNDVALLTLDRETQFNKNVRPICLASGGSWVDKIATVAGWGSLYEGGPQPGALQEVRLRVWSLPKCRQYYGNTAPGGIVSSYICAGDGGKNSCMGDSGGPLVLKINNVWTQIGITSWGNGCGTGEYPWIYSRVSSFLPWINRVKAVYR